MTELLRSERQASGQPLIHFCTIIELNLDTERIDRH